MYFQEHALTISYLFSVSGKHEHFARTALWYQQQRYFKLDIVMYFTRVTHDARSTIVIGNRNRGRIGSDLCSLRVTKYNTSRFFESSTR